jgi:hypothetical protein
MMILNYSLGKCISTIPERCFTCVGANSFARITLPVRMNSHLQVLPQRLPGC